MRIGILGGVFNPPHLGHLVCAQEASTQMELDVVVLIPVGEAPHREIENDPGGELRFQMCEHAVGGDKRLDVSRLEVDRPGPSYTVDTLRMLCERAPEDERVLVMGGDQAASLPSWRDPAKVLELAELAVVDRGDADRQSVRAALSDAGLSGAELSHFEMPRIDISSTLVRERAAAGRPIRYLVPDAVASFVADRALYQASAPLEAG